MASEMAAAMTRQPAALRSLLADAAPVERVAQLLRGRHVLIVGTGTSWHAANHGVHFLRRAGVACGAWQSMDFELDPQALGDGDAVIVLSHTGKTHFARAALDRLRRQGVATVLVSGHGVADADLVTVEQERSAAYTVSHLATLLRLAQVAEALGADLGPLTAIPDLVAGVLASPVGPVEPPDRLLEFVGLGSNQWTAAEGALKVREAAYVAAEGLSVEQFLHGPAVAVRRGDTLLGLDGGGAGLDRLEEVLDAARACGITVHRAVHTELGEPLSVFALTVEVQQVALGCAVALGTDPDTFGANVPGREAWHRLTY
jgi:glucosamine--fructose-6-phosphate aminotransferase (isomerizing)